MSNKPKRKFWQVHLSTALLLVIFAGILVHINLHGSSSEQKSRYEDLTWRTDGYGWPFTAYEEVYPTQRPEITFKNRSDRVAAVEDLIVAIVILFVFALFSEGLVRWLERR